DYAANIEMAEALVIGSERPAATQALAKVATPNQHSIEEVAAFLKVEPASIVKTLIVRGASEDEKEVKLVALLLRGDKELSEIKAEKHPLIAAPLTMATDAEVKAAIGCAPGSIGPIGLKIPVIADRSVVNMADFVCGANEDGFHLTGVNWDRDSTFAEVADLRNV